MVACTRRLIFGFLLLCCLRSAWAADARFDLVGPKIDVRVTRGAETLPIASVPNLQPGDKLWIHPDLPPSQSVRYLLICSFLRGTTNPPPENWFFRIETWKKEVREEGVFITVPEEAQQAVLFMAPETGGDFGTLKSSVRGRPGVFVRASQDLSEAGFEQARIERYLADIRRVPPSDANELQKHSDLLARTLALKPNADCFKRSVDVQFTCLTQTGTQTLLDDGHGQNIVSALSTGQNSDFIQAASYTGLAGAGQYSAYVGAIVDLVRIMSNLHTAQYQYIPAIAFPQGEALNLRLNTPPSFHNPKSVLVIGLPSVQPAVKPPLRPADANQVVCLLKPSVVLPIEGAPLVFSTDFATGLVLHLNTPAGAPEEPDIPLKADAFEGGLILQRAPEHHVPLRDARPLLSAGQPAASQSTPAEAKSSGATAEPVMITGTILGHWGFDTFTGPTIPMQRLPGGGWHVINPDGTSGEIIAGKSSHLLLASSGTACVHTITADPPGDRDQIALHFQTESRPNHQDLLSIKLPEGHQLSPGNLRLQIQQFGQPKPDAVATQTFADPAHVEAVMLPAGDRSMLITGSHLASIERLTVGDLVFTPEPGAEQEVEHGAALRLVLPANAPPPPTHSGDKLTAQVLLNDGRKLPLNLTVQAPRPSISLLSRSFDPIPGSTINLSSPDDLPLAAHISFTVKNRADFPRNGRLEIETLDGTLRTVLTLAPSGGLVLQDPHTVVASLDPLRSFGPSAFGSLRFRVVYPAPTPKVKRSEAGDSAPAEGSQPSQTTTETGQGAPAAVAPDDPSRVSDWQSLGTLVRLPTLVHVQCTGETSTPCNLTGSNLFLIQAVSSDPAFATSDPVPDGFTGTALPVPHLAGSSGTLFLKLRDDPGPVDSATVPTSAPATQATTSHNHPPVTPPPPH